MSERDTLQGISREVNGLAAMLQAVLDRAGTTNGGNVTFTVNAGGVALWIAATCAAIALVVLAVVVLLFVDLSRKVDRVTDYQTATYMMAPQLKPKDLQESPK